jgi:hypothetical protein
MSPATWCTIFSPDEAQDSVSMIARFRFLSICIFLLTLKAQVRDSFEGQAVASIRYDPPAQPLSSADLARVQLLSVGPPIPRPRWAKQSNAYS